MGYQSSLLSAGLATTRAITGIKSDIDDKKAAVAKEAAAAQENAVKEAKAKEESILTTQNQIHIAGQRVASDEIKLEAAKKQASSMLSNSDSKGRLQYRDAASGKFIKRYDYEKAQTALQRAQEQSDLAKDLLAGYKAKLEDLKGGNI